MRLQQRQVSRMGDSDDVGRDGTGAAWEAQQHLHDSQIYRFKERTSSHIVGLIGLVLVHYSTWKRTLEPLTEKPPRRQRLPVSPLRDAQCVYAASNAICIHWTRQAFCRVNKHTSPTPCSQKIHTISAQLAHRLTTARRASAFFDRLSSGPQCGWFFSGPLLDMIQG